MILLKQNRNWSISGGGFQETERDFAADFYRTSEGKEDNCYPHNPSRLRSLQQSVQSAFVKTLVVQRSFAILLAEPMRTDLASINCWDTSEREILWSSQNSLV